ncbi:MAG: hypothetical protein C0506_08790 [Anaerolinea sp.]|nr:hypothetical protein [Anaerolinea sp.]
MGVDYLTMRAVTLPSSLTRESSSGRYAIPRRRTAAVGRERLLKRLHAGIGTGLSLIQAPAGYGKTTLLGHFAHDIDDQYSVRWVSLDASSTVPEMFAQHLAAAIQGNQPVQPPASVARPGDLAAYLGAILQSAADASSLPILLIIDNAHVLRADPGSGDLAGWLVENVPQGMEIVISGRELPECPALDELIATGSCLYLGASDLAFDEAEVQEAISASGSTWSPVDLMVATGGWPVGVMSLLAGREGDGAVRQRRSPEAFDRYLATEVWGPVPAQLRGALLQVSIPDTVTGAFGRETIGESGWLELSRWLSSREFLCEPLEGDSFRLNPLLREFLESKFKSTAPKAYAAATGRHIEACLKAGRVTDAIETARAAGHHQLLADLIEEHGSRLILQGAFALLWRAIETIPADVLEERPLLFGIRARVLAHRGLPHQALTEADAVLADPAAGGQARVHALLGRLRALRLLGKRDEALADATQLRAVDADAGAALAAELMFHLAEIDLSVSRDLPRAERLLTEAIKQCDAAGVQPLDLLARSTLGQLMTMRGDAPGAVTVLTQAANGWRRLGRSSNLGWVLNNLGMAHLQAGDFESAVEVLEEARLEGIRCGNARNAAYAIASLAEAQHALGHYQQAREQYEEAIRICAEEAPDETLASLSIAGLSAALLALGDVAEADFFSRRALLVALTAGSTYELAFCRMQQGAVESVAGNHVVAVDELQGAIELFREMDARSSLAVAYYRLALCHFRANRRSDAQEALRELDALMTEPWMAAALLPLIREHPMFAQWAASRNLAGDAFRVLLERQSLSALGAEVAAPASPGKFPAVVARSLGRVSVAVGGRAVSDEAWSSVRAKELFFLFLANRSGVRKEEAVEMLYPELSPEKCNSAFHSNLHRLRRAIYQESVVKQDGTYLLNPAAEFEWDVDQFEAALQQAQRLPRGSRERANAYESALDYYRGPFAEAFFSEWASSIRDRTTGHADQALTHLAGYYAGRDDFEAAAACVERVLANNRLNEEAAYQLAEYRAAAGQPAVALAFLDSYRSAYAEEMGDEPPERFGKLRTRIAGGLAG